MSVIKTGSKRLALSLTMVLAATTGQAEQQQQTTTPRPTATAPGATQQRTVRAGTTPYVFMLVPADRAAKQSAAKGGCWAKIYDGENYMGDTLTLTGPISLADMTGPFGLNWDDRVNSVEIGSKATLTVFDNEAFRDQVAQFKSGQKVADISKKLGFFDEFASVRLTCSK